MIEAWHPAAALLSMFVIPSTIHTFFGPTDDEFEHMLRFFVTGVILFLPTIIALHGISLAVYKAGIVNLFTYHGDSCQSVGAEACTVGGELLLAWIGLGVFVYWLTYVAGLNIRTVLKA
jgi:hypothetical protein